MKTILTTLLIIIYLNVNAQLQISSEPKISFVVDKNYNPKDYVSFGYKSEKVEINGDTIKTIQHMYHFIKQLQKENEEKTWCIYKAVEFTNTIPDYFTKNKKWKDYQAELKKQGYKTIIKKPKK